MSVSVPVAERSVPGALGAFDGLLGRPVSFRAVALLRVLLGPITLLHLWPFVADARAGSTYRDAFWEAYASWYPQLPRGAYVVLLWVGVAAAVALTVGWCTRLASVAAFAVVAYNLFATTTHFHNNAAYLAMVLGIVAMAPAGRELSVDAWWRRRRGRPPLPTEAPAWPLWLLRFEASAVYFASGFSKLVDPDWWGGLVTWGRVSWVEQRIRTESPLPGWAVDVLANRTFHTGAAKVIVLTELFLALGLWWRPTRYAAVWVAVLFHVGIELSASVQVFSYLALAMLVVWAVPSVRDRELRYDPATAVGGRVARWVPRLDWLARFRLSPAPDEPLAVVDRDGSVQWAGGRGAGPQPPAAHAPGRRCRCASSSGTHGATCCGRRPESTVGRRDQGPDEPPRRRQGGHRLLRRARHQRGGGVDARARRHPLRLHRRPGPARRAATWTR